jgi:hypothetical protein
MGYRTAGKDQSGPGDTEAREPPGAVIEDAVRARQIVSDLTGLGSRKSDRAAPTLRRASIFA